MLLYSGPKLPESEVAILGIGSQNVEYFIIDGNDITKNPFWPAQIHMLPGKHEIKWAIKETEGNFLYQGHGILNAKAGVRYQVWCTFKTGSSTTHRLLGVTTMEVTFHRTWIDDNKKGYFTEDWEDFIYPNSTEMNPNVHKF